MEFLIGTAFIVGIIVLILTSLVKIVNQSEAYVIERLGAYQETWGTGIHILLPFVDRIAKRVSLKEHVVDFAPQPVITKDNVTMQIDTIVYFQVTDAKLFTYGVNNPMMAVESLTATTLRNIIGDLDLDSTLTSRDIINTQMRSILDEATDPWGIKVNRVEVKNIVPPREIQDAMEKQMKAERERREAILQAEGKKSSEILLAEGEKLATILRAEAKKEQQIKEAQGQAEAILLIQKAYADSLTLLSNAEINENVVKLKGFETMEKVADGKSTKIIIPSELQNLAGTITAASEFFKKD